MHYDVYGIGNALVDIEFHVTLEQLKVMNVEKGLMTLVDEKRQNELMSQLKNCISAKRSGGSAANTMIAISQFGGRSFYSYKVAKDEFGEFYLNDLRANNVVTKTGDETLGVTGKCLVMITPDADRTMNTFLGVTESFSENEIDVEALAQSTWLYIEGYLVTSNTGRPAAIYAKSIAENHGVKTALTFSDPNMLKFFREGMRQIIGKGVDLLLCNEDEAKSFAQVNTVEEAAEALKSISKQFVVTLGSRGALAFDGNEMREIETQKVQAIDTNGAGDMFAGACLFALTRGDDFFKAAQFACRASSVIVTQYGARLKKEQSIQIMKEFYYGR